jgi:hypothetical protein
MVAWKAVQPLGCVLLISCSSGSSAGGAASDAGRPPPAGAGGARAAANGGTGGSAGKAASAAAGGSGGSAGHKPSGGGGAGAAASAGAAGSAAATGGAAGADAPVAVGSIWQPRPGSSWQYQLSGKLDASVDAAVYDIDLETSAEDIAALHEKQRKVVCYFDTAYEPGRSDSAALAPFKGNPVEGWPGQYWLDIREPAVLEVMLKRMDIAKKKLCDGVEADDVDSRSNNPGFPITAADQQGFIIKLADAAHARGLAFGLKNDLEDVSKLVSHAEFAVNEECFEYDECDKLAPFIAANKPVFNVEYTDGALDAKGADVCERANALHFDSIIKHIDVDPPRFSCR